MELRRLVLELLIGAVIIAIICSGYRLLWPEALSWTGAVNAGLRTVAGAGHHDLVWASGSRALLAFDALAAVAGLAIRVYLLARVAAGVIAAALRRRLSWAAIPAELLLASRHPGGPGDDAGKVHAMN